MTGHEALIDHRMEVHRGISQVSEHVGPGYPLAQEMEAFLKRQSLHAILSILLQVMRPPVGPGQVVMASLKAQDGNQITIRQDLE